MKYVVECRDENHIIQAELPIELKDDETIEDVAFDEVISIIREEYEDIIEQALDSPIVLDVDGRYSLWDISDRLYPGARDYIARNVSETDVHLKEYEGEEEITDVSIPLAKILDRIIEERMECESWHCDLGGIIEDSLLRFEKEGSWHFGLIAENQVLLDARLWPSPSRVNGDIIWQKGENVYNPTLWFANSDTPITPWALYKGMSTETQEFWMETEDYSIMQALIEDCDENFLVWYFLECGRSAPNMEEIKRRCLVNINTDIGSDAFWNSFNEFFLDKYAEAQSE